MQTFVAYARRDAPRAAPSADELRERRDDLAARRDRVEAHYAPLRERPTTLREAHGPTAGLLVWDSEATPSRWPSFVGGAPGESGGAEQVAVATVGTPLGVEALVGDRPVDALPEALADALVADPNRVLDVTGPFVLARLDPCADTLDLYTDCAGMGRLFEVATADGWVWSNRPLAALLFAGVQPRADERAWLASACADVFFQDATPYEGVSIVGAATHERWDGAARERTVTAIDLSATWLFATEPVVDLSGGRDSRMVAAAFIAAGGPVSLHTHDGIPGDLDTAVRLVGRLDPEAAARVTHEVRHIATGGAVQVPPIELIENARRWHAFAEGLRPYSYFAHRAPATIDGATRPAVGGVGGEIAHGRYYPKAWARIDAEASLAERIAAYAKAAHAVQTAPRGPSARARAVGMDDITQVLVRAAARGAHDASMLDHYYLHEKMRRWGSAGERNGIVSPLLAPGFLRAGLALTPEQRQSSVLQRAVLRHLQPAWADEPFFPGEALPDAAATARVNRPSAVVRAADALDADAIEAVLADPQPWADAFDVAQMHALWRTSAAGESTAVDEKPLRALIWRTAFADHLADVRGAARPTRPLVRLPEAPPTAPARGGDLARLRRDAVTALRRNEAVRALVRSDAGRALAASGPVRALRARLRGRG